MAVEGKAGKKVPYRFEVGEWAEVAPGQREGERQRWLRASEGKRKGFLVTEVR